MTEDFDNHGRGRGWNHDRNMSWNAANALDEGQMSMASWLAWTKRNGFKLSMPQALAIAWEGEWHHIKTKSGSHRKERFAAPEWCPEYEDNNERKILEKLRRYVGALRRHPDADHRLFPKEPTKGWSVDFNKLHGV